MNFTNCRIPIKQRDTEHLFPCADVLNENRTHHEIIEWWNVPYIDELVYEESGLIGVYVLDGATWDCPRKISEHDSFEEAVSAANFYIKHSPLLRRYHETYQPTAKVDHLLDMSSLIRGKMGRPTEQELFDYMFHWLPPAEAELERTA
ncbi:hypothetical protein C9I98_02000 [Photobacterium sanctipauli]|uniref:Uncharacterized protein n=1 Tax=Photobacterium sanctipauli TaxID=1342794 RepID=A0A2T3P0N0_9GAMM|nr:hypothetical protein [Photobacterium sanctipauli]PSW22060.1 hypothetical protein C9I98_02000 [Photobacterium sanctipauli]